MKKTLSILSASLLIAAAPVAQQQAKVENKAAAPVAQQQAKVENKAATPVAQQQAKVENKHNKK